MKDAKILAFRLAQSIKKQKEMEDQELKRFHPQATNEIKDIIAKIEERTKLINIKKTK